MNGPAAVASPSASPPPSYSALPLPGRGAGGAYGQRHHANLSVESLGAASVSSQWLTVDPRASSTQSLAPSIADDGSDHRRRLLIVYIHGFYGNDQSFRSFPAHVHNYLKATLAESHVVHSKIYPRLVLTRIVLSLWLEPPGVA